MSHNRANPSKVNDSASKKQRRMYVKKDKSIDKLKLSIYFELTSETSCYNTELAKSLQGKLQEKKKEMFINNHKRVLNYNTLLKHIQKLLQNSVCGKQAKVKIKTVLYLF